MFLSAKSVITTVRKLPILCNQTRTLLTSSCCLSEKKDFSRFPVPALDSLPEDVQERFNIVTEKSGFTPNVFRGMSYRPEESRAFFNYYDVVMNDRPGGNLTKADKEMIVVATSAENKCLYCIVAHSALHRIFAKNPYLADQIAANWKTADLDDRQRAILEVAIDLCHCRPLTEEKCENLKKNGLTDDDLWDIGAVVALFALSNRMAFTMNLKPNEEFYLMGRVKKEKK
ncbi:uncharacterized protein LOC132760653 [Ruditapes philippinarum]|uniref:uncharacterized protein LOC132760653 n=1 Tax=Ruditapes philippinarum TaxID=129788 RepID=UPI00295A918C|nr:uncharacterized protein LOC132760653 [Ruditapes philippinarum]